MLALGALMRPFGRVPVNSSAESGNWFPLSNPIQGPERYSIVALEGNSVVPIVEPTDLERRDKKREERALRRQQLELGKPFRPYDLFDRVMVIPEVLIANTGLSPEKS